MSQEYQAQRLIQVGNAGHLETTLTNDIQGKIVKKRGIQQMFDIIHFWN